MPLSSVLGAQSLVRPGVCTSSTRPASPFEGQLIFETDTNRVVAYDGSNWVYAVDTDQPPGLQLVKTQTIGSAVSSVTVSDAFSADFDNYKIVLNGIDCSTDETVYHMKLSGSTGSTYSSSIKWTAFPTGTMSGTQLSASSTGWIIGLTDIDGVGNGVIDVISPFLTTRTSCTYQGAESGYMIIGGGYDTNSASHTGFSIHAPSSNTLTGGTIRVYGYRNS